MGASLLALTLIAVGSRADEPEPVIPDDPGIGVVGVVQASAASWQGPYAGTVGLNLNGESLDATISSELLLLTGLIDNFGRQVVTSSHTFDLGNGHTFSTVDDLFVIPTQPGWYTVVGRMQITSGTGNFTQAWGWLDVFCEIHEDGSSAHASMLLGGRVAGIGS